MGASHGANASFFANGYALHNYLSSATFSGTRDQGDTTTFKKKSKTYIPGLKDTTMAAEGIYDGAPDAADEILSAALNSNVSGLTTYGPYGTEQVLDKVYTVDTIQTSYEINTEVGDVSQISAEFAAGTEGRIRQGEVIAPFGVYSGAGTSEFYDYGSAGSTSKGVGLVVHKVTTMANTFSLMHGSTSAAATPVPGATLNFGSSRGSLRIWIPSTQGLGPFYRVSWTGAGTFVAIIEK